MNLSQIKILCLVLVFVWCINAYAGREAHVAADIQSVTHAWATCTSRLLSMTPSRTGQKCKMKKIIWCQLMTQCCNPNYSYIYQHNHDTYTQSVILYFLCCMSSLMADMQNQATLYTRQTFLFSFFDLSFVSLTVCSPLSPLRLVRFTAHTLTLRHDQSNTAFQTTQIKCWKGGREPIVLLSGGCAHACVSHINHPQ